jgi:hypothetical protein
MRTYSPRTSYYLAVSTDPIPIHGSRCVSEGLALRKIIAKVQQYIEETICDIYISYHHRQVKIPAAYFVSSTCAIRKVVPE